MNNNYSDIPDGFSSPNLYISRDDFISDSRMKGCRKAVGSQTITTVLDGWIVELLMCSLNMHVTRSSMNVPVDVHV